MTTPQLKSVSSGRRHGGTCPAPSADPPQSESSDSRRSFLQSLPLYAALTAAGASTPAGILRALTSSLPQASADEEIGLSMLNDGFLLRTRQYTVRFRTGEIPCMDIFQDDVRIFRVPAIAGLWSQSEKESLTSVTVGELKSVASRQYELALTAKSSLWEKRKFHWTFHPDRIEFWQDAQGASPLGRCYFLSNGVSGNWDNGTSPGVQANTSVFADQYFSPAVNLADQYFFTIGMPQSVGIAPDNPVSPGYHPDQWAGDFAPPPLFLAFHKGQMWTSVGIGTRPGAYLFNGLEYTGSRYAGASFYVNYLGYQSAADGFESPRLALHFADSQFSALDNYVRWVDVSGFSTSRRSPDVRWHHLPIFCGWGEQENQTRLHAGMPRDFCTQEKYESWVADLEAKGLPIGTIIIDDKWQRSYGTFEVDEKKWPDLQGFISHQHAKDRHVLLWVPGYHQEGLDKSLCVLDGGTPVAADTTNPRYEELLRSRIKHLVHDLGADGFKEDWIGGVPRKPGVQFFSPLVGIEFTRRFQFILHDETHRWKPDAMIETQTPNPLFRESSDVLRLNDIWYGARGVTETMRRRARIAHIAGWPLVDCDDASSTDLEEWWAYMQVQPIIGIPSLYITSRMKTTLEDVPPRDWVYLGALWKDYISNLAL